jgi:hypothetical protein
MAMNKRKTLPAGKLVCTEVDPDDGEVMELRYYTAKERARLFREKELTLGQIAGIYYSMQRDGEFTDLEWPTKRSKRYDFVDANPALIDALMRAHPNEVVVARRRAITGVCESLKAGNLPAAQEWALDLWDDLQTATQEERR